MDIQQHFDNQDEFNKLVARNLELKKELEREQVLHTMLYKEWKELSEKMSSQEHEAYENSRPKNLFYKYAFFLLLIALIPAVYFLYPQTGSGKLSASPPVAADSLSGMNTTTAITEPPQQDSISTNKEKQISSRDVSHEPAQEKPIIKTVEKTPPAHDSSSTAPLVVHKPVIETPLTNEARDSISSDGFSAYFNHRRNPYRRNSERYKVWAEGWKEGKAEGEKVVEKNPTVKQ
ncbi:hypothetical protein FW778_21475 [Ginsengibacter hankyongi]|uniref:Uncharacterized protein n=1 Tax=Ginsengibacter hankyongi TaxID=2607284 RepID=A0A5J5IAJ4_9BACT|nr:hypothetical protein [Ginsengibacter hankyongi]KAA9035531.1 hypothetical protein FW778_21475 [Ginsengibacter hankyongi]